MNLCLFFPMLIPYLQRTFAQRMRKNIFCPPFTTYKYYTSHFIRQSCPETTLSLLGQRDDPNNYLGVVGCTNNASYAEINLAGGFAEIDYNLTGFSGKFIRV